MSRLRPVLFPLFRSLWLTNYSLICDNRTCQRIHKMGVSIADSDSEVFDEKVQTTTAPAKSYCPWALFKQLCREYREKREQQYRPRIDEIREQINKNRAKVEAMPPQTWHDTTSTEQRRILWNRGLDSGSLRHHGYKFSTKHSYRITTSTTKAGSKKTVIQDFRTPEGREEAFKWWEAWHLRHRRSAARILALYDDWEEGFQIYAEQHHSYQRKSLLLGRNWVIHWIKTRVTKLPN